MRPKSKTSAEETFLACHQEARQTIEAMLSAFWKSVKAKPCGMPRDANAKKDLTKTALRRLRLSSLKFQLPHKAAAIVLCLLIKMELLAEVEAHAIRLVTIRAADQAQGMNEKGSI